MVMESPDKLKWNPSLIDSIGDPRVISRFVDILSSADHIKENTIVCNFLNLLGLIVRLRKVYLSSDVHSEMLIELYQNRILDERFQQLVGPLSILLKDQIGSLRKNAGLLLAKLLTDPPTKEFSLQFKSMELLMNLSKYLT